MLTEDGHQITLEEVEDQNIVELLVNGEVVFHCNIQDLEFGEAIGTLPTLLGLLWAYFSVSGYSV